ncbi:MAG: hypothetical protein Q8930_01195 [Bacillota bacterium]|nr:hypothetical protein [Bacillota bacterium]
MNKTSIVRKTIAASLTGAVMLSTQGLFYAGAAVNNGKGCTQCVVSAVEDNDHAAPKASLKDELQKFVDDKVITAEQAKKIEAFLQKKMEEKKAEHDKLKGMTEQEREKYIKENAGKRMDFFGELISSGIINKEQADKMKAELQNRREAKLQEILKMEVTKGTLKQEQLDKINEFLTKKKEERMNEHEKLKNMTEEERKHYISQHPKQKSDLLAELVSAGIISKEQGDALSRVLPQLHRGHNHKGAPGRNPSSIS